MSLRSLRQVIVWSARRYRCLYSAGKLFRENVHVRQAMWEFLGQFPVAINQWAAAISVQSEKIPAR